MKLMPPIQRPPTMSLSEALSFLPAVNRSISPRKRGRPISSGRPQDARRREVYRIHRDDPDAHIPRGRIPTKTNRTNVRARELRQEKIAIEQNRLVDMCDPEAQKRYLATRELPAARKQFSGSLNDRVLTATQISNMAQSHENTKRLLRMKGFNKNQKRRLATTLTQGLDIKEAVKVTGLSHKEVKQLVDDRNSPTVTEEADGRGGQDAVLVDTTMRKAYVDFFLSNTEAISGAKRDTRTLAIPKHDLLARLFGEFPSMLRRVIAADPTFPQAVAAGTRLDLSIKAIIAQGSLTVEEAASERTARTRMKQAAYRRKLDQKRQANGVIAASKAKQTEANDQYDEVAYQKQKTIQPVGDDTFWSIIKTEKIKFTCNLKPTYCEICENGGRLLVQIEENAKAVRTLQEKINALIGMQQRQVEYATDGELKKQLKQCHEELKTREKEGRDLGYDVLKFERHQEQYRVCREEVLKIQEGLVVGECVCYRDFVSQYCWDGTKMCNLQLVVLFRCPETQQLLQVKVSNFAHKETLDAHFVADVMDLHMKGKGNGGSGLFDKFHKVVIVGDHGTHFSDVQTVYNESCMFEKYRKQVHVVFLCSYHAYNRCDAAGVLSKKLAHTEGKAGNPLRSASEYADIVNNDERPDTVAYTFTEINRSKNVFGNEKLKYEAELISLEEADSSLPVAPSPESSLQAAVSAATVSTSSTAAVPTAATSTSALTASPEPKLEPTFVNAVKQSGSGPTREVARAKSDGGTKRPQGKRRQTISLREICEIAFDFKDANGDMKYFPGLIKCRVIPFQGPFRVVDLRMEHQQRLCMGCTQTKQYPTEKHEGQCPLISNVFSLGLNLSAKQEIGRVQNTQLTRRLKAAAKVSALVRKEVQKMIALSDRERKVCLEKNPSGSSPEQKIVCGVCRKGYKTEGRYNKHVCVPKEPTGTTADAHTGTPADASMSSAVGKTEAPPKMTKRCKRRVVKAKKQKTQSEAALPTASSTTSSAACAPSSSTAASAPPLPASPPSAASPVSRPVGKRKKRKLDAQQPPGQAERSDSHEAEGRNPDAPAEASEASGDAKTNVPGGTPISQSKHDVYAEFGGREEAPEIWLFVKAGNGIQYLTQEGLDGGRWGVLPMNKKDMLYREKVHAEHIQQTFKSVLFEVSGVGKEKKTVTADAFDPSKCEELMQKFRDVVNTSVAQ